MELRHLRYFVAVAQELHFGRAALRLRMAQPPLSQQILKLEAELGVALFDRSRRRVELTKAGGVFLDEAKAILLHVERAAEAAQRSQRGQVDRLVVSFAPWIDLTLLPLIIRTFGERHPDVHVQLRELNVPNQILAFRAGQIQVGFLYPPVHDRNLAIETIFVEPLIVAFPAGHRLETFTRVPPDTLADEPQILLSRERAPAYHDLVVAFCRDVGFTVRVRHEAEHPQQVLSLVAAGMGIALVPASAVTFERRELHHRPLDHAGPRFEVGVAWRRSDASPLLHTFLDFVRNRERVRGSDADRHGDAAPLPSPRTGAVSTGGRGAHTSAAACGAVDGIGRPPRLHPGITQEVAPNESQTAPKATTRRTLIY